ncbi:Aim45 protein [Martiniozyma asiatica (nom. inval.)]|nr:Aim45 protein [Martiniozyma asiatica]
MSTLALLHHTASSLTPASLAVLSAARSLAKPVTALLIGPDATKAAGATTADSVLTQSDAKYTHPLPENLAPLLVDLIKKNNFTNVLVPGSALGKAVLPRAAAMLDIQPISDVIEIDAGKNLFKRQTYAGNIIETVKSNESIIMASIRTSAFAPEQSNVNAEAKIEEVNDVESPQLTNWVSENVVISDKPDLGSAKVVVSGGRALKDKENFDKLLNPLAEKLGAAIGASRAAVDDGFCDNSLQVGQTGKIIAPDLYVALGISGAIQHLAGMKDSKVIVAVNNDPESPIFKLADVGLVGDIFEVVPELVEKL